jgi:hypothetical protein
MVSIMPEARRTNPGFLSNNEAARDRKRTQDLVRGLATGKEFEQKRPESSIESRLPVKEKPPRMEGEIVMIDSDFWVSDAGSVVKAIVLSKAYRREAIMRVTGLSDARYRNATTRLFEVGILTQKYPGSLWVTKELYMKCLDNQKAQK